MDPNSRYSDTPDVSEEEAEKTQTIFQQEGIVIASGHSHYPIISWINEFYIINSTIHRMFKC